MPTGGVSPENIKEYLAILSVLACGGTWMVPNDLIENDQWDELSTLISAVINIVN